MKNADKAFIQGYNGQIAVDVDSQIIVAAQLSNQAADGPHLVGMVEQVEATTKEQPGGRCRLLQQGQRGDVAGTRDGGVDSTGSGSASWMSYRLTQPENREWYRKREQSVEPVFG
jgi:hypothetical protein